jgi:hypothetical protein
MRPDKGSDFERAVMCAYHAGRIQALRLGDYQGAIYVQDINSAYPSALADLPDLADARVTHVHTYTPSANHAVWYCRWKVPPTFDIMPFPSRLSDGSISYPNEGEGWYWATEVQAAMRHYHSDAITVTDGYIITPSSDIKPFAFCRELYARRAALKAAGHPAEYFVKLALNALYGKVCQRLGRFGARPSSQCYIWAGMATAAVRAKILDVAARSETHVISIATDAIISDAPLVQRSEVSTGLGQWSVRRYSSILIVRQGFYVLYNRRGQHVVKSQGVNIRNVDIAEVRREWGRNGVAGRAIFPIRQFHGMHAAADRDSWLTWTDGALGMRFWPSKGLPIPIGHRQYRIQAPLWADPSCPYDPGAYKETIEDKRAKEITI